MLWSCMCKIFREISMFAYLLVCVLKISHVSRRYYVSYSPCRKNFMLKSGFWELRLVLITVFLVGLVLYSVDFRFKISRYDNMIFHWFGWFNMLSILLFSKFQDCSAIHFQPMNSQIMFCIILVLLCGFIAYLYLN